MICLPSHKFIYRQTEKMNVDDDTCNCECRLDHESCFDRECRCRYGGCLGRIEYLEQKVEELENQKCECECKLDHDWCSDRSCFCHDGGCLNRISKLEEELEACQEELSDMKNLEEKSEALAEQSEMLVDATVDFMANLYSQKLMNYDDLCEQIEECFPSHISKRIMNMVKKKIKFI